MTKRVRTMLALLATALLAICILAVPALAEPKDEPYTVHPNGTVTFDNGSYPTAYKVTFNLPEGLEQPTIPDEIYEEGMRNALAVQNQDGTIDYYCWPDCASCFLFSLPDGYVLDSATVSPASAGKPELTIYDMNLKLSAPATVTVAMREVTYNHVDTDPATGISVAISSEDLPGLIEAGAKLSAPQITDAARLANIRQAVESNIAEVDEEDDYNVEQLKAFDVAYYDKFGDKYWGIAFETPTMIPLPDGWKVDGVRVYEYYEYQDEDTGTTERFASQTGFDESEDGTAVIVNGYGNCCYVLTYDSSAVPAGPLSLSDATVTVIGTQYYTGDPIIPEMQVELNNKILREGKDYTVSGFLNTLPGIGFATVKGTGNYTGSKTKIFIIWIGLMMNATVSEIADQVYTGSAIEPKVTVMYKDKLLVEGVDYKLTYSDNVEEGTASVKIENLSNYYGSKTVKFNIVKKTGWQNENGGWYCYDANGRLLKDTFVPEGGKYYYVGKDGKLVTGGWIKCGGRDYYIDKDWSLALNRWVEYAGKYYYFGSDAQIVTNAWFNNGADWYYIKANGQLAVNEWVSYQGHACHFNKYGICDYAAAA